MIASLYRRKLMDRKDLNEKKRLAEALLKTVKDEIIDSRAGTYGKLEPTNPNNSLLTCNLKFTKKPEKHTIVPTGDSKLKAVEVKE